MTATRSTSPMFRAVATAAAIARHRTLEAQRRRDAQSYLDESGPTLTKAVLKLLGDAELPAPELLPEDVARDLWRHCDNDAGVVAVDLGDVVFTLNPDRGESDGLYAAHRCENAAAPVHFAHKRWVRELADIGDLLADATPCLRCNPPAEEPLPAREVRRQLATARVAVDGGSDSDNLAVIAHNLGVIAQQLDNFFDCGASMAGRGT